MATGTGAIGAGATAGFTVGFLGAALRGAALRFAAGFLRAAGFGVFFAADLRATGFALRTTDFFFFAAGFFFAGLRFFALAMCCLLSSFMLHRTQRAGPAHTGIRQTARPPQCYHCPQPPACGKPGGT